MNSVDRYLTFGLRRVTGWLDPYSADVVRALSEIQNAAHFAGAVGEIGVHHGKLFILLALTAAENERTFAVDVFESQTLNVDESGLGDRERFLSNVRRWVGAHRDVVLYAQSSLDLRPNDILTRCGRVRLASIDGGHTAECTENDLRLIEAVMSEQGIAVLDDYFNQLWPGVSAGAARYFLDPKTTLRPFAISPNKTFLTTRPMSAYFRSRLKQVKGLHVDKTSEMYGEEVDVYGCFPRPSTPASRFKEFVKAGPVGPYLLAAKRWIERRGGGRDRRFQ